VRCAGGKKVKGHPALPIDERTGARKELAKDANEEENERRGGARGLFAEGKERGVDGRSRQVSSLRWPFGFQ
jgi:hypothetical protein